MRLLQACLLLAALAGPAHADMLCGGGDDDSTVQPDATPAPDAGQPDAGSFASASGHRKLAGGLILVAGLGGAWLLARGRKKP